MNLKQSSTMPETPSTRAIEDVFTALQEAEIRLPRSRGEQYRDQGCQASRDATTFGHKVDQTQHAPFLVQGVLQEVPGQHLSDSTSDLPRPVLALGGLSRLGRLGLFSWFPW